MLPSQRRWLGSLGFFAVLVGCGSNGGAVCCLEPESSDAGSDAIDDVSPSQDAATEEAAASDGGLFCVKPLSPNNPATFDAIPWQAWCASSPGRVTTIACDFTIVSIGVGVDCNKQYYFDRTTNELVAVIEGCNFLHTCVEGNPHFLPGPECASGPTHDYCDEYGFASSPPDGAGNACHADSECPAGYRCGYFTNGGCGAQPECFYGNLDQNPTCSHVSVCACDGSRTEGCEGPWGGYTLKPVSTRDRVCAD